VLPTDPDKLVQLPLGVISPNQRSDANFAFASETTVGSNSLDGVMQTRTVIWNQRTCSTPSRVRTLLQLPSAHQGVANTRPLHPLSSPISDPVQIAHLDIRRRDRSAGTLHEYQHAA
jgi:hypothetical protein